MYVRRARPSIPPEALLRATAQWGASMKSLVPKKDTGEIGAPARVADEM
jgi:hypothetical protein